MPDVEVQYIVLLLFFLILKKLRNYYGRQLYFIGI